MPSKVPLQKSPTSRDAHWLQGRRVTHGDRTMYAAPEALSVAWAAGQPGGTAEATQRVPFSCECMQVSRLSPCERLAGGYGADRKAGQPPTHPCPTFH